MDYIKMLWGISIILNIVIIISIIASWLIVAAACGKISDEKGRSYGGGFALGFFLGILGFVIISALVSDKPKNNYTPKYYNNNNFQKMSNVKVCSKCGATTSELFCPCCGKRMGNDDKPLINTPKNNTNRHKVEERKFKHCKKCGTLTSQNICPYCGYDRRNDPEPEAAETTDKPTEATEKKSDGSDEI